MEKTYVKLKKYPITMYMSRKVQFEKRVPKYVADAFDGRFVAFSRRRGITSRY